MKIYYRLIQVISLIYPLPCQPAADAAGSLGSTSGSSNGQYENPSHQKDSASENGYQDYVDAYIKSQPFVEAAKGSGIRIEPKSVSDRIAAYREIYPGQYIDSVRVERQLLAEKFLEKPGHQVSDNEIQARLEALGDPGKAGGKRDLESIKQALKAEYLFHKREIVDQGEASLDLVFLQNQEIMQLGGGKWPLDRIQLAGASTECLAWLHEECYATLGEYNAAAAEFRVPQGMPLDSARALVFRKYLGEKYFAGKDGVPRLDRDVESALETAKIRKEKLNLLQKMRGMGRPVRDPKVLNETYDKYYRRYFKAREEVQIGIIGSSDSSYIDSLHRLLVNWEQANIASRKTHKMDVKEPDLPWLSFKEEDLPAELVAPTDTFFQGQFTSPLKTRLGHFISRVMDIKRIKEVPFKDAQSKVVFLATRDKYMSMDSVMEARSRKYYKANPGEFLVTDTLALRAWLIPFIIENKGGRRNYALSPKSNKDTLDFAPIEISSLNLPQKSRKHMQSLEKADSLKSFFGPLKGEYGQWYFRVKSRRKAGDTLPFPLVKNEIRKKLGDPGMERESSKSGDAGDEALLALTFARVSREEDIEKLHSLTEPEIESMIRQGKIDASKLPKDLTGRDLIERSRQQLVEQLHAQHLAVKKDGMKKITIEFDRLFRD